MKNGIIYPMTKPVIKSLWNKTSCSKLIFNYLNRKWKYFPQLQTSAQKTTFPKYLSSLPRSSKLMLREGLKKNGIFHEGSDPTHPPPLVGKKPWKMFYMSWNEFCRRHWIWLTYFRFAQGKVWKILRISCFQTWHHLKEVEMGVPTTKLPSPVP